MTHLELSWKPTHNWLELLRLQHRQLQDFLQELPRRLDGASLQRFQQEFEEHHRFEDWLLVQPIRVLFLPGPGPLQQRENTRRQILALPEGAPNGPQEALDLLSLHESLDEKFLYPISAQLLNPLASHP